MLSNTLQWLEESGISNVLVVVNQEDASAKVGHYLMKVYEGAARVQVICVDAYGTVDALRAVKDKIHVHFLIIQDFVMLVV